MSDRERTHVVGSMKGYYIMPLQWKPNWIDYRASRGRADDRGDAPRCPHCECELDRHPTPHSPRCKAWGGPLT